MKEHMRVSVNGIGINYEAEGEGPPIILLHGNGEDHTIFDRLVSELKKEYRVFSIDTRGHGGSERVPVYHYSDMVEDVAAFISELGIEKPILYGFSDGGIVGLMLASRYPGMLSGLIASGANLSPKDLKLSFRLPMRLKYMYKKHPFIELMLKEPNITEEDLRRIDVPVLITIAENDIIPLSHAERMRRAIPDCRLVPVAGEDHSSYIVHSDKLFPLISDFIEGTARSFVPGSKIARH